VTGAPTCRKTPSSCSPLTQVGYSEAWSQEDDFSGFGPWTESGVVTTGCWATPATWNSGTEQWEPGTPYSEPSSVANCIAGSGTHVSGGLCQIETAWSSSCEVDVGYRWTQYCGKPRSSNWPWWGETCSAVQEANCRRKKEASGSNIGYSFWLCGASRTKDPPGPQARHWRAVVQCDRPRPWQRCLQGTWRAYRYIERPPGHEQGQRFRSRQMCDTEHAPTETGPSRQLQCSDGVQFNGFAWHWAQPIECSVPGIDCDHANLQVDGRLGCYYPRIRLPVNATRCARHSAMLMLRVRPWTTRHGLQVRLPTTDPLCDARTDLLRPRGPQPGWNGIPQLKDYLLGIRMVQYQR